ncbi:alcohol dehydrogenase 1-like [Anopheles aquasalis]|uniref:alcohol dehydrogenase 1-like n=1 Tax=Anopheles aquasalis TaxID=42839 RepID=UPI00215ADD13|nr:alcohol dehydrogenase 1-like [Anopheles aquasalis]
MSLKHQKAVVIGGSGDIGVAICQNLLQEGVEKLFVLDVADLTEATRQQLQESNRGAAILFKHCDIANRSELLQILGDDIVKALGSIDILVNSAGIASSEIPDQVINVNLTGVINSSLLCLDLMSRSKGGKGGVIVNVASVAGLETIPFLPIYCASKHGVVSFSRSLGVPPIFASTGVKFVAICPGATRTKMFNHCMQIPIDIAGLQDMFDDYVKRFQAQSPDVVGKCVIRAITEGENGSAWICNEGVIVQHQFPQSLFL